LRWARCDGKASLCGHCTKGGILPVGCLVTRMKLSGLPMGVRATWDTSVEVNVRYPPRWEHV
jgi:hypothetical protein